MRRFGLIGFPLSHSFSPAYFKEKFKQLEIFDASYELFPLEAISDFPVLIKEHHFTGLNVTIPYKEKVMPYLDEIAEAAQKVGAVNTIEFKEGKLIGHNTDVFGFQNALKPFLAPASEKSKGKALILGTGGAAKAIRFALSQLDIPSLMVSRQAVLGQSISYNDLWETGFLKKYSFLINTTPLGMAPNVHTCPEIPYELLNENHLLFDLVYNPSETLFLKRGLEQSCRVKNGLEMLELQAEKSWEIWNEMK